MSAFGQTTSGVITGQVEDSQGAAIPQAKVTLTDQQTTVSQSVVTDKNGYFVFPAIKPATYTVSAESAGFQRFEKKNVNVLAADRIAIGVMHLPVGAVSSVVEVHADVTPVQTTSSERSTVITSEQMTGLLSLGRDFTSLLRIVPGSTYEGNGNNQLNTASVGNFNGVSNNFNSINTDGVASNIRNVGITEGPLNMDAIQEIKVLNANYQAEYGKVAGAIVDVVSKSGTKQFHGSFAYYFRNEAMNANSYFSNRSGVARARYRYNTITGTIGGPIYGPGPLKSLKDKLFFFYSQDYEPSTTPLGISQYTVPTALERQGDFSQSYNSSGQLYVVTDPETGKPFPGNKIPSSRINPDMQKLLSIFPLPNFTNTAVSNGDYNYVISGSSKSPAYQEELRIDYNPSDKLHTYFRGQDLTDKSTSRSQPAIYAAWMPGTVFYNTSGPSFAVNATYTPTNNIVNELALGVGLWFETTGASQSTLDLF
ncbi:MAG TPA: TonB-dependent receptor, partial [Edaphobacter sp.]|nr:TonB-dependent receptor [Edaphobacter sp.]